MFIIEQRILRNPPPPPEATDIKVERINEYDGGEEINSSIENNTITFSGGKLGAGADFKITVKDHECESHVSLNVRANPPYPTKLTFANTKKFVYSGQGMKYKIIYDEDGNKQDEIPDFEAVEVNDTGIAVAKVLFATSDKNVKIEKRVKDLTNVYLTDDSTAWGYCYYDKETETIRFAAEKWGFGTAYICVQAYSADGSPARAILKVDIYPAINEFYCQGGSYHYTGKAITHQIKTIGYLNYEDVKAKTQKFTYELDEGAPDGVTVSDKGKVSIPADLKLDKKGITFTVTVKADDYEGNTASEKCYITLKNDKIELKNVYVGPDEDNLVELKDNETFTTTELDGKMLTLTVALPDYTGEDDEWKWLTDKCAFTPVFKGNNNGIEKYWDEDAKRWFARFRIVKPGVINLKITAMDGAKSSISRKIVVTKPDGALTATLSESEDNGLVEANIMCGEDPAPSGLYGYKFKVTGGKLLNAGELQSSGHALIAPTGGKVSVSADGKELAKTETSYAKAAKATLTCINGNAKAKSIYPAYSADDGSQLLQYATYKLSSSLESVDHVKVCNPKLLNEWWYPPHINIDAAEISGNKLTIRFTVNDIGSETIWVTGCDSSGKAVAAPVAITLKAVKAPVCKVTPTSYSISKSTEKASKAVTISGRIDVKDADGKVTGTNVGNDIWTLNAISLKTGKTNRFNKWFKVTVDEDGTIQLQLRDWVVEDLANGYIKEIPKDDLTGYIEFVTGVNGGDMAHYEKVTVKLVK